MNENILDRKLFIKFNTGINEEGKDITSTKTISNIRLNSTGAQLGQFVLKYTNLTSNEHIESLVADYYPVTLSDVE